ncbi:MAG: hypothetical protein IT578_06540 [Verrucomicrobiae bacterium]|nr:hypothetical protein [Verrucomicrobiae bacterium]
MPAGGLFADKDWRIAPRGFPLAPKIFRRLEELGPRLLVFSRAANLLYRRSVEGKAPEWIARYLDAGKSKEIVALAREAAWKNNLPAVFRPDLLLTEHGFVATEFDSVPGGIGATAWMQTAYGKLDARENASRGMLEGFRAILENESGLAAIVVSDEARDYRPEMEWLAEAMSAVSAPSTHTTAASSAPGLRVRVCRPEHLDYRNAGVFLDGERVGTVYRFFELFDLPNVANWRRLADAVRAGRVRVTPPFKPQLEEKLWMALFWFPQLADFWRRELGDRYFRDLREVIPFTWLLDPTPLPPHAVIPRLEIHDWRRLGEFSQKRRDLVLKVSGFSPRAWGGRGVWIGSDLSADAWQRAVEEALEEHDRSPRILQPFAHSPLVEHEWFDFETGRLVTMRGRVRLCPYWFVVGQEPRLGGVLATICPADKKLIHGMKEAILTLAVDGRETPNPEPRTPSP